MKKLILLAPVLILTLGVAPLAPMPRAHAKDASARTFDAKFDAPLIAAIQAGNAREVGKLLKRGANPNARETDTTGTTALGRAAPSGNLEIVKMLVEAGANLEDGNALKQTPMLLAVLHSRTEIIAYLAQRGAQVDSTQYGFSALMLATLYGDNEAVRALIRAGANVNVRDARNSNTALTYAVSNVLGKANLETVRLLVGAGADLFVANPDGKNVLVAAQDKNLDDIADYLYAALKPHLDLYNAGSQAAGLSNGVFPNAWNDARQLLDNGAKGYYKNKSDETALLLFALDTKGFDETIAKRLIAVSDVDAQTKKGVTALHIAADGGNEKMAALLIAAGANLSLVDNEGNTPFDYADSPVIVTLLRNAGAKSGQTTIAAAPPATPPQKQLTFADLLSNADNETPTAQPETPATTANLASANSLDEADGEGHTALMRAAMGGKTDEIARLIQAGATVDLANEWGGTALFSATWASSPASIKALVDAGADINHQRNNGDSILEAYVDVITLPTVQALIEGGLDRKFVAPAIPKARNKEIVDYLNNLPPAKPGAKPKAAPVVMKPATVPVAPNAATAPKFKDAAAATVGLFDALQAHEFDEAAAEHAAREGGDLLSDKKYGLTPLMFASANGTVESVRWLLSKKVPINATDVDGTTALMLAARRTDSQRAMDIVIELLDGGAKPELKDKKGKTALALAKAQGNTNAALMLDLALDLDL